MAGVSRRGKAGKYRFWYTDEGGKRKFGTGFTGKARSLKLAEEMELHARREREGLVETGHRQRQAAASRSLDRHIEDFRLGLVAGDATARHAKQTAGAITRLLGDAGVTTVADLAPDRIREALGRLRARRSPRTCNHALGAVKAFASWLMHSNRIKEVPRGLMKLSPYSQEKDRVRVRRALTDGEFARLLAAAESGPTFYLYGPTKSKVHKIPLTGPERATLYRVTAGTGFRAEEVRSLTPESFALDGDDPRITVEAAYAKNGKTASQPIRRDLAERLRPWLASKAAGRPVFALPGKTGKMIAADLKAAGVEYKTRDGYADFHSLRAYYITGVVNRVKNPEEARRLARHSDVRLTLQTYTKTTQEGLRAALEGGGEGKPA